MIRRNAIAAVALVLMSMATCTSSPVSVGLVFENDWTLEIDTLSEREQALVKDTALQTLRRAFDGFGVSVSEGPGGDRLVIVDKGVAARFGPGVGQPGPVGETYAFATASHVHVDVLWRTLLATVGCGQIVACNKKTREQIVEGLGQGIGASAAHEIGHQVGFRFALDSPCDDCYDSHTSNTSDHFFGTKHWSADALAIMRQTLPSDGNRGSIESRSQKTGITMAKTDFKSVDEYIASQPEAVQGVLKRVRSTIRKAVPGAEEVISYKIPTYKLHGRPVLYFAGWRQHYSLYPSNDHVVAAFKDELAPYEINKGTIRFPLSEPVPVKLIEGIAKFRAKEVAEREKAKATAPKKR